MRTKSQVAREILELVSADDEVTSRGGTVTRVVSDRVNETLGLGLSGTKQALPRRITEAAGVAWDATCVSRGGTVTLVGLERLLESTKRLVARQRELADEEARQLVRDRIAEPLTLPGTTVAAEQGIAAYEAGDAAPPSVGAAFRPHEADAELCQAVGVTVAAAMPAHLDGREGVRQLRTWGNQWRQIEWIGWWVEHRARSALVERLGGAIGPKFLNTTFDYQLGRVFDIKSHVGADDVAVLNDVDAVDAAVVQTGAVGFIIVRGDADYDDEAGTFYTWHRQLQGKAVEPRTPRSRRRKTAFHPRAVDVILFPSIESLREGQASGQVSIMRQGRQASGAPRPPKYRLHFGQQPAPGTIRVGVEIDGYRPS